MSLSPFDYQPRTRLIFGAGTLSRVGELARDLGAKRVLVVTDPGIAKAGYPGRAIGLIEEAGLAAHLFAEVHENPSTIDVDHCVAAARDVAKAGGKRLFR